MDTYEIECQGGRLIERNEAAVRRHIDERHEDCYIDKLPGDRRAGFAQRIYPEVVGPS